MMIWLRIAGLLLNPRRACHTKGKGTQKIQVKALDLLIEKAIISVLMLTSRNWVYLAIGPVSEVRKETKRKKKRKKERERIMNFAISY